LRRRDDAGGNTSADESTVAERGREARSGHGGLSGLYQVLMAALDLRVFELLDRQGPSDRNAIAEGIGINGMFSRDFLDTLRMLKQRGRPFHILEKDTRTLKPDEMIHYVPPE
jgi:hypothetical protein